VLLLFPGAKRFPSTEEQVALEAAIPLAQVCVVTQRLRAVAERAMREDPLTGVLGRPAFLAELAHLARRTRDALAVMVVQVDGIAELNERSGFTTGDAVLREVGSRLAATVRGRDVVGRCSGSRFAVACAALGAQPSMAEFGERVQRVLDRPVVVGEAEVRVAVRLGTATRRGRVADPDAILRDAERAVTDDDAQRDDRVDRRSGSAQSDR
jgi:diguanylate cyclase (GGDEF)-like protein